MALPNGHHHFIFSDVKKNTAYAWTNGTLRVLLSPSGCNAVGSQKLRQVYFIVKSSKLLFVTYLSKDTLANVNGGGDERCQNLIEPGSNGLLVYSVAEHDSTIDVTIVACQHGNRRLVATTLENFEENPSVKSMAVIAETFDGMLLNSPNDVAQHPLTGDLFFTDPAYGLNGKDDDSTKYQSHSRVYRIDNKYIQARVASSNGNHDEVKLREPTAVLDEFARPNGVAFSIDGTRLFVSNSDKTAPDTRVIKVFDVAWQESGNREGDFYDYSITNGRIFARADEARSILDRDRDAASYNGNFDGVKVDSAGNVFTAGPGGVHVYNSAGEHLGVLLTGVKTGNIALGEDGFLYIAADTEVRRIARS